MTELEKHSTSLRAAIDELSLDGGADPVITSGLEAKKILQALRVLTAAVQPETHEAANKEVRTAIFELQHVNFQSALRLFVR